MLFSNSLSKFGKGQHLSAFMPNKDQIEILYFLKGIEKKVVDLSEEQMKLKREGVQLGYSEAILLDDSYILTRIDKSFGIKNMGNMITKNAKTLLDDMQNHIKMANIAQKTEKTFYKGE